jgi:hypothetical protein
MYEPQVGHSVSARRKSSTGVKGNLVIGPVASRCTESCTITNNAEYPELCATFVLPFSEWDFRFLHLTEGVWK